MKKNNYYIDYLSLMIILSYAFIHNIYLVLLGISISAYLINIEFIDNFIRHLNKKLSNKKGVENKEDNEKVLKTESSRIILINKDSKPSLVETIEELGFIPSLDKNDDSNAA